MHKVLIKELVLHYFSCCCEAVCTPDTQNFDRASTGTFALGINFCHSFYLLEINIVAFAQSMRLLIMCCNYRR